MQTLSQIQAGVVSGNKNVFTHMNGDADSYLSVCLYAHLLGCKVGDLKIAFVPSGIAEIPAGAVGLDVTAGFKGIKSSCFEELVNGLCNETDRTNLKALATNTTLQDQGKLYSLPPNIMVGSLGTQIATLRASNWTDLQILAWVAPLFDAHLKGMVSCSKATVMDALFTEWLKGHFKLEGSLAFDGAGQQLSQFERWVAKLKDTDDRAALQDLAQHITLQVTGKLTEQPADIQVALLGKQLLALKSLDWTRKQLQTWLEPLFVGHLKMGRGEAKARKALESCPRFANGRVVLLTIKDATTTAAFQGGAHFVIYVDGLNMGIVRNAVITEPNLKTLFEGILPQGFYLDERGFIAAWGSRKSPATTPCPIEPVKLAELLASKL